MLRPYGRGEAGFGCGYAQATVAEIVCGFDEVLLGQRNQELLEAFFGGEIDSGWFTGDDCSDGFGIFGGRKFTRHVGDTSILDFGISAVEQYDRVAFVAEADLQNLSGVIKNPKDADNRRGIDCFAERLVVEADIAAGDRRVKRQARPCLRWLR